MADGGVGRAVRRARLEAALTQRELARRAGLSVGALRDLEQGRSARPRPESVALLARALDLSTVDDLLRGDDLRPPPDVSAARSPVVVRVLGALAVHDGTGWRPVDGRGQSLTLGLLALHVGTDVTHHALAEVLWPDGAPDSAAELLRSYVARLRRRLAPVGVDVESGPGRYRLVAAADACDVSRFRADVRAADATTDPERATALWVDALALWPSSPPADQPDLRGAAAAVALDRERVRVAVRLAASAVACGRPDQAVDLVVALAERDPLDESLAAAAIRVLAASGRMAAVQAVHTRTRRALADDLGLDPGPELAEAFRSALRRGSIAPPGGTPVVPAGPERAVASSAPAQLPRTLRALHGRVEDLTRVVDVLTAAPGAAPAVVVVTGMGGLGKTTLAVAAAHAVADRYPDGQLFVDLDGVGEPLHAASVLEHFLVSLGHERASLPGDVEALTAAFRTTTANARCLVVLDNAAGAEQVESLLPGGPGCGVLITSRRSLTELDDAVHVPLAVLTGPEALELMAAGVGRARVESDVPAAEKIVALCGGLPLALRMVVARLTANPSWQVADVATMLGDEHGRLDVLRSGSRAVRASFALSHRALPPGTARVFHVATVVPGPTFTAAAVAAALGGRSEATVRAALDDLVDRGMLGSAPGTRYRFHDLLRAFAEERGREDAEGTDGARTAVLQWLEGTAADATQCVFPHRVGAARTTGPTRSPDLDDPVVRSAAQWLDRELDTLAAGVSVAATTDPALAWRLADAASGAFRRAATSQEFERAARAGLAAADTAGDERGSGLMAELLARAYVARCDHEAAVGWFARACASAVRVGWTEFEVSVRENWGISLLFLGRHLAATEQFETALRLARTTGLAYWEAACRNDLGNVDLLGGRVAAATTHYRSALQMNRDLGDAHGYLVNLSNLAHAGRLAGRPEEAWDHIVAALEHPHAGVDRPTFVESTIMQAEIAVDLGRPGDAADLARQATEWATQLEQPGLAARARLALARACLAAACDLATAERVAHEALATARRVRVPELVLDAHLVLSAVALRAGDLTAARQQAAAVARLAAHHDNPAGSAEATLALARILLAEGDAHAARDEAVTAGSTFRLCGHGRGVAEAAEVLARAGDVAPLTSQRS